MVIDIIYNIALLLSVSVVYATYPFKAMRTTKRFLTVMGVAIGLVGMLIMSRPFVLSEGIVFDGRSILIGVTGMFFGPIPSIIASCMMVLYRIYLGGSGMVTGISVISTACAMGVLWHGFRYKKFMQTKSPANFELYIVGLLVHVVMLGCMFLIPNQDQWHVVRAMSLPILLVYPVGSYLLSMLLFYQVQRIDIINRLEISEHRFKTMFEQAPMGITVTDSRTGTPIEVNGKFLEIIGRTRETFSGVTWMSITHPDDIAEDKRLTERLINNDIDSFTLDKRFLRPDGTFVWVNMAISILKTPLKGIRQHLCMVTDITERKTMEEAILYANSHDPLTDLFNRTHFERKLKELDRGEVYPLAVAIGDVNGLKLVNDAFGREAGDGLLIRIAREIQSAVGPDGYCARIGGDEYAMVLPATDDATAWALTSTIQQRVATIGVRSVEVTVSFGVSVKHHTGEDLNEVVKQAENALNRSKLSESPSARSKAINTIINTLHEKNRREELHSRRVSVLGVRLAEALGLGNKEVSEMRTAGLLHDIGKIAIDESILNKDGVLDEAEWDAMKRHPETGYRILGSVGELGEVATFILSHHERMDGMGYPRGLRGEEIPLQARIITIVDAYDAMTAARPYREAVGDREAAAELKRCSGTQFDTDLTRLFVEQVLQLSWDDLR
ncbi:MAG: hypothetical protein A2Y31_02325 [Spirochaetes bacterium GWC2_52_13]|nr:MAG: hypothetical protein A2Y31_02325 [Spirochaetes bacterium GWC2_52_13]